MKFSIVHYKFSHGGGPENYLFNITRLLKDYGHQVIHFAPKWNDNLPSPDDKYWPEIEGSHGHFNFNDNANLKLTDKLKLFRGVVYNDRVYQHMNTMLKEEKPDVVLLLLYLGKLTPAVIKACTENKVPIISRISDFSHICLNSILHDGTSICTDCIQGNFWSGVKKNCFRSKTNSFLQYIIRKFYYYKKYQRDIDAFLIPSRNSLSIFRESKLFSDLQLHHVPSFVTTEQKPLEEEKIRRRYTSKRFIYSGRISPEKDLQLLIYTFQKLLVKVPDAELVILGFKNDPYSVKVKKLITDLELQSNIICKEFVQKVELLELLDESAYMIFPSKIYDNLPQAVLEAQSIALPVIAPGFGSLAEIIQDGVNGLHYDHNDSNGLFLAMSKTNFTYNDYLVMARRSWQLIQNEYSAQGHYNKLMEVTKLVVG